jgi:FtsP/CotA-like multicopper oxidase with cupredoxin domain
MLSRRHLLRTGALAGAAIALPPGVRAATPSPYVPSPPKPRHTFRVGATSLAPDGGPQVAGVTVNGTYPGPEIRAREGDLLRIEVQNALAEPTSIHWHGILLPAGMDGVPDVSSFPIAPQRTFVYEFPLRQTGTYWYHSHWGLQEQLGLAGPLVIEAAADPLRVDRDVVVMLSDWLHRSPDEVLATLRKGPDTPMQMQPGMPMKADLSDVTYDAFLLNGRGANDPWTLAAKPGERIRLRVVNAGSSTYFRIVLDGHPLQVTHADGLAVEPVTVDQITMGMAESYDVVVTLSGPGSWTLHAIAQDGSGQAVGVLHTPDVKPAASTTIPPVAGRALAYADLRAPSPTTLPDGPARTFALNLQGDMSKYVWTIDGQVYPKADPLVIRQGERVQVSLANQTMMWHPMHLHGHFFRVLQGAGERAPLKHTVNVAPKETVRIEFTADNPGRWIFHCHNLYHLEGGMARVFEYEA